MSRSPLLKIGGILFLLGIFTCTWDLLLKVDIGGITLKAQQLFFGLAFACAVAGKLAKKEFPHPPFRKGFFLSISLLGIYYISTSPWSTFPLKSLLYSCWLIFNLCCVWWALDLLALPRKTLWVTLLAALLFHSVVILIDQTAYQYGYTGGLLGFNQDAILKWGVSRPHAFASEPSYIAAFLSMGMITAGPALLRARKALFFPFALVCVIALVATTSRTGLFGFFLGAALLCLLEFAKKKKFPWRTICLGAAGISLVLGGLFVATPSAQREILNRSLVTSLLTGSDGSGNARLSAHQHAADLARESHWLGVGLGASYRYWMQTRPGDPNAVPEAGQMGHELVMSIWGQLLAEGGIPALLLYASAMFFLLRGIFRRWQREDDPLVSGSLAASILFFTFVAFLLGNVARGDIWVWFAIWSRMALPDTGDEAGAQRA